VRFWEDTWLGNKPLREQYPGLYSIVRNKFATIAEVLTDAQPTIIWRWLLGGPKVVAWNHLYPRIIGIVLTDSEDEFSWVLNQNK
jgi:hypothetical protein